MKITIDTKYKTIEILEAVILADLLSELSELAPEYMNYKIIRSSDNNWYYNAFKPYSTTTGRGVYTSEKGTFIS